MFPSVGGICVELGAGIQPRLDQVNRRFLRSTAPPSALFLERSDAPPPARANPSRWGQLEISWSPAHEVYRHCGDRSVCVAAIQLRVDAGRADYFLNWPDCTFGPPLDRILFARLLADRGRALAHAAGLVIGGQGVLLGAASGGGKTTLANLAEQAGVEVLSDERVVVGRDDDGAATLWGTPWYGEGGQASPGPAPLARVLLLEQASANGLEPLRPAAALARLLSLCTLPCWSKEATRSAVDGLSRALEGVPAAVLRFVPDSTSVDYLRDLLTS